MDNSNSGLELTPELALFSLGVGAELKLGYSETELELEWSFENKDGVGVEWS